MADDNFLISAFHWNKFCNELVIEQNRWKQHEIPKVIYVHGNTRTVTYDFARLLVHIEKAEFLADPKQGDGLPRVYVKYEAAEVFYQEVEHEWKVP